jgi:transposase-like protein
MAVDRLRKCDNVVALSEELGVHRRLLYKWRQQLEPLESDCITAPDTREFTLTKEIFQLKRLLAEKVQEVDFFKGALQKVEARRQNNANTGATASTTKSGK